MLLCFLTLALQSDRKEGLLYSNTSSSFLLFIHLLCHIHQMGKSVTIDNFFQRKRANEPEAATPIIPSTRSNNNDLPTEIPPKRFKNTDNEEIDLNSLERDPGLRRQIWEYHPDQRGEIRRAYLNLKAYQPILQKYPLNKNVKHPRRFQSAWYEQFPWLEYSVAKDKAYCFPCFIFNKPSGYSNQTVRLVVLRFYD